MAQAKPACVSHPHDCNAGVLSINTCNKILKKDMWEAKKIYYFNEFKKHINDIKNTWNIIQNILNRLVNKSTFPKHFLIGNVINSNDQ